MTHTWSARSAMVWLSLAATSVLMQGCSPQAPAWNGVFGADTAGQAKTCSAPPATPLDGQAVLGQIQMNNDGGWCGMFATRQSAPFASYLMVTRPKHGRVFAHRVGDHTRLDYTPDPGFAGADSFAIRMIPGGAVIEAGVTVTK